MRSDSAFAENRLDPHPAYGMLAIQFLRLPRSSEAWFGIAVPTAGLRFRRLRRVIFPHIALVGVGFQRKADAPISWKH
jgi:hypothetical protein